MVLSSELLSMMLLAAEGGGEASNPMAADLLPMITAIIVFGAAFWILARHVWPRITHGLDERERKIKDEIQSAEEAREQARAALQEYEQNLSQAREEAAQMIAKAKSEAKAAGEELRRKNEEELGRMKQRATQEIEAAKQNAITELHDRASELASTMAAKILEREINADDQQRLIEQSLDQLAELEKT